MFAPTHSSGATSPRAACCGGKVRSSTSSTWGFFECGDDAESGVEDRVGHEEGACGCVVREERGGEWVGGVDKGLGVGEAEVGGQVGGEGYLDFDEGAVGGRSMIRDGSEYILKSGS